MCTSEGIPSRLGLRLPTRSSQTQAGDAFGQALTTGDLDGDGFDELVVAAPRRNAPENLEGNVLIWLGSRTGVQGRPSFTLDNPDDEAGGGFGASIDAAGDIDADGFQDLVVGSPGQSAPENGEGNVFLYFGSPVAVSQLPDLRIDNPDDDPGDRFGNTVASGADFDGDGRVDLAVGAPGESGSLSRVDVLMVLSRVTSGRVSLTDPRDEFRTNFGDTLDANVDIDGDGLGDLIVGALNRTTMTDGEGTVHVYSGTTDGEMSLTTYEHPDSADNHVLRFGIQVLSAGDVDGDGRGDAVGAARRPFGTDGPDLLSIPLSWTISTTTSATGWNPNALAAGDLNGDGYQDVLAATNGTVIVVLGGSAGLVESTPLITPPGYTGFASALAR